MYARGVRLRRYAALRMLVVRQHVCGRPDTEETKRKAESQQAAMQTGATTRVCCHARTQRYCVHRPIGRGSVLQGQDNPEWNNLHPTARESPGGHGQTKPQYAPFCCAALCLPQLVPEEEGPENRAPQPEEPSPHHNGAMRRFIHAVRGWRSDGGLQHSGGDSRARVLMPLRSSALVCTPYIRCHTGCQTGIPLSPPHTQWVEEL